MRFTSHIHPYASRKSMKEHIQKIISNAHEIDNLWSKFSQLWISNGLPVDTEFPRLYGETFKEYHSISLEMLEGFHEPELVQSLEKPKFLPKIEEVNKHLEAAKSQINTLLTELYFHPKAKFQVVEENLESIQGFINGEHVVTINIGNYLDLFNESLFKAHHVGIWWCVAD
jgi:hypothetical protein